MKHRSIMSFHERRLHFKKFFSQMQLGALLFVHDPGVFGSTWACLFLDWGVGDTGEQVACMLHSNGKLFSFYDISHFNIEKIRDA